jgi:hypothetical protein
MESGAHIALQNNTGIDETDYDVVGDVVMVSLCMVFKYILADMFRLLFTVGSHHRQHRCKPHHPTIHSHLWYCQKRQ